MIAKARERKATSSLPCPSVPFLVFLLLLSACGNTTGQQGIPDPGPLLFPGLYDFFGTFADDPMYADGTGDCAIPPPLGCPSVTTFCIYKLLIQAPRGNGIQEIRGCSENPVDAHYDPACEGDLWNVAVGSVYMMPFVLSVWDGGGQVVGSVDPNGGGMNAASGTDMVVEEKPGLFPSWRIASWSTSPGSSPDSPPGTMVLTIPYENNLKPPPPADSPPGTYSPPASTTHHALCRVTNPEAGEISLEATGSALQCNRARLVTPHAILRTLIGGFIPIRSDVLSITTWDGTFCRRTDPEQSCVPEDFSCPDLHD